MGARVGGRQRVVGGMGKGEGWLRELEEERRRWMGEMK